MDRRTLTAEGLLLLTAAIWGFAFVAQRAGMEHVGPFLFNGLRFALGAAFVLLLRPLIRRRAPGAAAPASDGRRLVVAGVVAGTALFLGASLQQVGLVYTTAGKAGFITGLYVVLVPLLARLGGHPVGRAGWAGAALAAVGLYLLSVRDGLRLDPGDALVFGSAFCWAAHVLVIARFASRTDVLSLACAQYVVCALASFACAAALESWSLPSIRAAALPILYGGVASVGIAYTLQVVAQRRAPPTAAAILLSLESVFAAIGGAWLLDESLGGRALVGCAAILGGVLVSQRR